MILIDSNSTNKILGFIPKIRSGYHEWHIITLRFTNVDREEAQKLLNKFIDSYKNTEGFCYLEDKATATGVIKLGQVQNYSQVQQNIEKHIDNRNCKILANKMNANGLKNIQINLSVGEGGRDASLFIKREERKKNVVLIAEDDLFIRKVLSSLLKDIATIYEVEDGDAVLKQYQEINPDIVLLDIHLPNKSGLDVIKSLNREDSSAFIIVSSSDSVKGNVLQAIERGAIGFLAKPIQKDKLFLYIDQCTTFQMHNKTLEKIPNQITGENFDGSQKENINC